LKLPKSYTAAGFCLSVRDGWIGVSDSWMAGYSGGYTAMFNNSSQGVTLLFFASLITATDMVGWPLL